VMCDYGLTHSDGLPRRPACRVIVLNMIKRNKLGMAAENCIGYPGY